MADDSNEKWSLPEPLDINKNPEVQIQAEQMRRELQKRVASPFASLSPTEFAKVRAQARVENLSKAIRQIEQRLSVERGVVAHKNLREARDALKARMAENLAVLEHWGLAAALHPDPAHQAEYAKKINRDVLEQQ